MNRSARMTTDLHPGGQRLWEETWWSILALDPHHWRIRSQTKVDVTPIPSPRQKTPRSIHHRTENSASPSLMSDCAPMHTVPTCNQSRKGGTWAKIGHVATQFPPTHHLLSWHCYINNQACFFPKSSFSQPKMHQLNSPSKAPVSDLDALCPCCEWRQLPGWNHHFLLAMF